MIEWLPSNLSQHDSSPTLRRRFREHLQEERLRQVEGTACREEQSAGCKKSHRAQVDLLVASQRPWQRRSGLGEGGRVEHDRIESGALALLRLQILERVPLDEFAVRQAIASKVVRGTGERVRRRVDRDDMLGTPCEMKRKRTMIAEAVERSAACDSTDERTILSLIE